MRRSGADRNTLPGRNLILEHTGTGLGFSLKDVVKVEASGAGVHGEMRVSAHGADGSQLTFGTRPKDGQAMQQIDKSCLIPFLVQATGTGIQAAGAGKKPVVRHRTPRRMVASLDPGDSPCR
jgi:hypothetical protein